MSITLTAAEVNALVIGGATVETDSSAAVTNMVLDFVANLATFQVLKGTTAGQTFTPGQLQQGSFSVTVNLVTGAWQTGAQSGTLSPAALTAALLSILTLRNSAESLANSVVLNGTLVPWNT